MISVDTIETLIDNQPKATDLSDLKDSQKKTVFQVFFNEFLDSFFETIDDENINLNLYEKFLIEIEKPLIYKTLKFF